MNTVNALLQETERFMEASDLNTISPKTALAPEAAGLPIYDAPIAAVADADDAWFGRFQTPNVVGPHHMLPSRWLPGAKTVVSFFFPFSEAVRKTNRQGTEWPSTEWMHGRIDGQKLLMETMRHLTRFVESALGGSSVAPVLDERFSSGWPNLENAAFDTPYTSNWSERHVAFAAGLGTFGLSCGLITAKGMAGRFGSLVTNLSLPVTPRTYGDPYEYCNRCGACTKRCPVAAISLEKGKDHAVCAAMLEKILDYHRPYYGCGKCQVSVPCEAGIPQSNRCDRKFASK